MQGYARAYIRPLLYREKNKQCTGTGYRTRTEVSSFLLVQMMNRASTPPTDRRGERGRGKSHGTGYSYIHTYLSVLTVWSEALSDLNRRKKYSVYPQVIFPSPSRLSITQWSENNEIHEPGGLSSPALSPGLHLFRFSSLCSFQVWLFFQYKNVKSKQLIPSREHIDAISS